jgi:hypothetical protein
MKLTGIRMIGRRGLFATTAGRIWPGERKRTGEREEGKYWFREGSGTGAEECSELATPCRGRGDGEGARDRVRA